MESGFLKPRAIVFDVYRTLLEVGEPAADVESRWCRLCEDYTGSPPPLGHGHFLRATGEVVARHHVLARSRGIAWPEVQWPGVVIETLPVLASLAAAELDDFVLREIQLRRSLRLADGAAGCLGWLRDREMLLGIASNAQAYTLRELDEALAGAGLDQSLFDPGLRFWSFLHGFSKPDPHVFRILAARLEARGIGGGETLMVGDHLNNDIGPALAHGWQAWHLAPHVSSAVRGGTWRELAGFLGG